MTLQVHNTLSGQVEEFVPLDPGVVKMYHCGPTVYGKQHIGNLSMFVFTDILRRTLEYTGYSVKQVINFTDFGHLTSDGDEGEDKMTKGLKREGLEAMGKKYGEVFKDDLKRLNIETTGTLFPSASEYVPQQIELIKRLEEKGFAYPGEDGIYFDTAQFPEYGKLGKINLRSMDQDFARVKTIKGKRNHIDFALWKFNKELGWLSPWGKGFPGWHIECSAMIIDILGPQIDIHTGGVEHIPVHHNNEIAQSEAATGLSPFSRFWLHRAHLQIGGEKIAKSEGNTVFLSEIIEKGFSPIAFRYFLLNSTYHTATNFTWEGLEAANNAYKKLKEFMSSPFVSVGGMNNLGSFQVHSEYKKAFTKALENDLNTPEALAIVWNLVKDETVDTGLKRSTLRDFDVVLGLDLAHRDIEIEIPPHIVELARLRQIAKESKKYDEADKIREEIEKQGYQIRDADSTFVIFAP